MSFGDRIKPLLTDEELYLKIMEYFLSHEREMNINELFEKDERRFDNLSTKLETPHDGTILVDYSKNLITPELLTKLTQLADVRGVTQARNAMMNGEKVDKVHNTPVLHTACRKADFVVRERKAVIAGDFNAVNECEDLLEKVYQFVDAVHTKEFTGCYGKPFTDAIVIGRSGFVLPSQMVIQALTPYSKGIDFHFIINVDGTATAEIMKRVQKCSALFIIISEQFDELDVTCNAAAAKNWFTKCMDKRAMMNHFVAVTNNKPAVVKFGILPENVFRFGEYVSGCHTVWSTVGLPVALAIGKDGFAELLNGGKFIDEHFYSTPLNNNLPVILAMIGVWYTNFYKAESQAVLPYDQYLALFPRYVQFLNMKSNGKSYLGQSAYDVNYSTGAITWGEPGTNGQHAFYQLLHQGTRLVPCDFIIPAVTHNPIENNKHHKILCANFLAQTEALMKGRTLDEATKEATDMRPSQMELIVPHKVFKGNRPSNSIVVKQVTPFTLGALMALYEHKAFVQSVVWDTDHFVHATDELECPAAALMLKCLDQPKAPNRFDQSTNGLMRFIKKKMKPRSWTDYGVMALECTYDPPVAEVTKMGELYNLMALSVTMFSWYLYFNNKL